jgi:hypothetical protein
MWNLKLDNCIVRVEMISYPSLLPVLYLKPLGMGVGDVKVLNKIVYTPNTFKNKTWVPCCSAFFNKLIYG